MNSRRPNVLVGIYQLPIIGNLLCHIVYFFTSLVSPLAVWLSGYKRIKCETSSIWAPKNKQQIILNGIECLRSRDAEMYLNFTKKRLFIYYSHQLNTRDAWRNFGLQERYIELGAEGVASFIVQKLFISDVRPSISRSKLDDRELAALKMAPRKAMEWMQQHSFDQRLINSYRKVVEKWEQTERFKNLPQTSFGNSTLPSAG
jgi:hypothetical protein